MNNNNNSLTELGKALKEGFTEVFSFEDGLLFSNRDEVMVFEPRMLQISVRPCNISSQTVYRITTACGTKGTATINWIDFENNF